jgi:hypothetical protein
MASVNLTKEEEKEFREVSCQQAARVPHRAAMFLLLRMLSRLFSLPLQIFNLVDRDKGGSISKSELAQLMETLAINASQQEIDLMITEIDKNNDGEIQFEEFVAVMSRKVQATYTSVSHSGRSC